MKKKQISPKIFTEESIETPKHDDMLVLYNKDSNLLKLLISEVYEKYFKKFENKKITLITNEKSIFRENIKEEKIKLIENPIEKEFNIKNIIKNIEIIKWEPEKPIINKGYYIGSVDLYIEFKIISSDDLYDSENNLVWERYNNYSIIKQIIIDFKPKIISYSETLRQIKVYEEYMGAFYFVITYSDISKFKNIFESQKIGLIQLKKEEKNG